MHRFFEIVVLVKCLVVSVNLNYLRVEKTNVRQKMEMKTVYEILETNTINNITSIYKLMTMKTGV